jgi:methionyl-tRNA synthetase
VATWGNLVNRSVSFAAKNLGRIPEPGALTDGDQAVLAASKASFATIGASIERSQQKAAIVEAMRVIGDANKYLSDEAPWKLRESDPDRMATILHVALQLVDDAKTLLTPFLPSSSEQVHRMLGGEGAWAAMPELREVDEVDGPAYAILTGDYETGARWESRPIRTGVALEPPTPLFRKLEPSIVEEELARLESEAAEPAQ